MWVAKQMNAIGQAATRDTYHHGDLRHALIARAAEVIESEGIEALTLRGLARDLGVSHAAPNRHFRSKAELLAALAAEGYSALKAATLSAADSVGNDPWVRLNAMGRGFLRWAFDHPASFRAIYHPDVERYADEPLRAAMADFEATVRQAVAATQATGRHPGVHPTVLTLFTNSVPFGVAMILTQGIFQGSMEIEDREQFIADLTELVVPIAGRPGADRCLAAKASNTNTRAGS